MSTRTDTEVSLPPAEGSQPPESRIRGLLGWTTVGIAVVGALILPLVGAIGAAQVVSLAGVALAFVQGTRRYGWPVLIGLFVISFVISNIWENLSILTGFPFGNYHYTLMPQLFLVPVIIGVTYFGLGYVSWMTANTVLDRADERLDLRTRTGRINVIALPVLAGAVMTMFDVGADSLIATVRQVWIWHDGGGLFGVPWTNYVGWWFVTWSFFQVFALVLAIRQTRRSGSGVEAIRQVSYLQPVLIYAMFAVAAITTFMGSTDSGTVSDATGVEWDTAALNETLMIINIFTIIPISLFAIVKILRGDLNRT